MEFLTRLRDVTCTDNWPILVAYLADECPYNIHALLTILLDLDPLGAQTSSEPATNEDERRVIIIENTNIPLYFQ